MKLKNKVEAVIKAAQDAKSGEGEHTAYRIVKECDGFVQGTIQRYVNGSSDIGRMGLDVAEKLGEYYDKYF
ncbi:hypothetical protein [Metasolibacillus sp.]|uniref:hypothetical protein n=1 Tax=Metasolibacillus sp. TaxID=2703680 RepID=UPI0025D00996|nr:hypothetical protein [Metasolibacillus sp.]MCT6924119.1 hypothetical protein [Metasolibacillus sp.]MCT6940226.1 hypothetical protein [Metasolibacillus sp.]